MNRVYLTNEPRKFFDLDSSIEFNSDRYHDGRNWISYATKSQFYGETMFFTKGKKFILWKWSRFQNCVDEIVEISKQEAMDFLCRANLHDKIEDFDENFLEEM